MNNEIPPELRSEVSSHILAISPEARLMFSQEEIGTSGPELEALCISMFLSGYRQALVDGRVYGDPYKSPIVEAGHRALGIEPS